MYLRTLGGALWEVIQAETETDNGNEAEAPFSTISPWQPLQLPHHIPASAALTLRSVSTSQLILAFNLKKGQTCIYQPSSMTLFLKLILYLLVLFLLCVATTLHCKEWYDSCTFDVLTRSCQCVNNYYLCLTHSSQNWKYVHWLLKQLLPAGVYGNILIWELLDYQQKWQLKHSSLECECSSSSLVFTFFTNLEPIIVAFLSGGIVGVPATFHSSRTAHTDMYHALFQLNHLPEKAASGV